MGSPGCGHSDLPDQSFLTEKAPEGMQVQGGERQNIRITFDFIEQGQISSQNQVIKERLQKICRQAIDFLSKSLKVDRMVQNIKFPQNEQKCLYTTVPESHKTEGIPNSDLHILISLFDSPTTRVLAYAASCVQLAETRRPVYGASGFNLAYMRSQTDSQFENYFETAVHEMIHILGFTSGRIRDFINPETGKSYGYQSSNVPIEYENINGKNTAWVTTPKVRQMAREHFGCPTLKGIQLENDYGPGSRFSHWEKSNIENDFMNAIHVSHDAGISKFTFALLEDSGWYTPSYEYVDEVSWGKGKGCDFLYTCDPKKHREFTNEKNFCSYYHNFIGYHSIPSSEEGKKKQICHTFQSVSAQCTDENRRNEDWSGNTFSNDSKCFDSNLKTQFGKSSSINQRCLTYKCTKNGGIDVYVKGQKYSIDRSSNRVEVQPSGKNSDLSGYIEGPEDWDAFCNSYPRACPKFCSSNGYCVKNQCHCDNDYAGEGCDVYCPGGNYAYEGKCLNSKQCPQGSSLQKTSKDCVKEENESSACKEGEVEHEGKCVNTCPAGFYKGQEQCESCILNCLTCKNGNICEECNSGKYLSNDKKQCRDCKEGCSNCDKDNDRCYSCESGYLHQYNVDISTGQWIITCVKQCPSTHYQSNERDCLPCQDNCLECKGQNQCQVCAEGYEKKDGICIKSKDICEIENCNKCTDSQNCQECKEGYKEKEINGQVKCEKKSEELECKNWQYVQNNKCVDCAYQCYRCSNGNSCDSCYYGHYHDKKLNDCLRCPKFCIACNNSDDCIYCGDDTNLLKKDDGNQICVKECPAGYNKIEKNDKRFNECVKQ